MFKKKKKIVSEREKAKGKIWEIGDCLRERWEKKGMPNEVLRAGKRTRD